MGKQSGNYSTVGVGVHIHIWGFPKIRGTILGVHIIRAIVFWGLSWDLLILGNYHIYTLLEGSAPTTMCVPFAFELLGLEGW